MSRASLEFTAPSPELFRAIAEFTYDWESWVDERGGLRWLNAAVERITGYTVAECLSQPDYPMPLVYPEDRPIIEQLLERAARGESGNHVEFRIRRKDGTLRWGAISWQPLRGESGTRLGFRTSVRDIHGRKQAEAELQQAVRRAEQANRAKTQFLANVTHELRTPLQSIMGYAQLLSQTRLSPTLDGYTAILMEQSEHLADLVDELLDFSSLQAGVLPLRKEVYEPQELVARICQALVPIAEKKGLALTWNLQCTGVLSGDPQRIAQVLRNLIGNGIKFTSTGGIRVSARVTAQPRTLEVVVDDDGPGLPDDETLFDPFRQGTSSEGPTGGVGLGLAISLQLCTRMGGSLTPGASDSGGGRMTMRIPGESGPEFAQVAHYDGMALRAPAARPPSVSSLETSLGESRPLSILVLDDVEHARHFMREALSSLGYGAHTVASASEADKYCDEHFPDVVLVDIQMPQVDGFQAASDLRDKLGELPYLVALTAQRIADDARRLTQAGFDGYAPKPLKFAELQALLIEAHAVTRNRKLASLSRARLEELQSIRTTKGHTLLQQAVHDVVTSLPGLLKALQVRDQSPEVILRTAHDACGLFGTLGASAALDAAERCEDAVLSRSPYEQNVRLLVQRCRQLQATLASPDLLAQWELGVPPSAG